MLWKFCFLRFFSFVKFVEFVVRRNFLKNFSLCATLRKKNP